MKNKYFLFSISLAVSVFIIMILSIFVQNIIFEQIAQAITIPFLLFTLASFMVSVAEEIINMCKSKTQVENEKFRLWNYYAKVLEKDLKMFSRYEKPVTQEQIKTNELLDEREEQLHKAAENARDNILHIDTYSKIVAKFEKNLFLQITYALTLTMLIVSMMITPVISKWCQFIPTTTLTLLSLFLTISEILVKDTIADNILNKMFNKIKKQTEDEINGQTENAQSEQG